MLVRVGLLSGQRLQLELSNEDAAALVRWLSVGKTNVLSLPGVYLVRGFFTDVITGEVAAWPTAPERHGNSTSQVFPPSRSRRPPA